MHSSVCHFLLCIRESTRSQSVMTFHDSNLRECMLQNPLQFTPMVTVTGPDERGEQAGTLRSRSSKVSDKPVL